jgi:hypothetical protein
LFLLVIASGLWLWMAWANKSGRPWARMTATVFFGLLTAGDLADLIKFLTEGISLAIGVVLFLSFLLVYWLAGLCAVVLLWQRSSSDYYAAVGNWSKAIHVPSRNPHDQPKV